MLDLPIPELPEGRPVLLLDFDGVINAFQAPGAVPRQITPFLPPMRLFPGVEQLLSNLNDTYYVVWCTNMAWLLNRYAVGSLGLDVRPAIQPTAAESGRNEWKVLAVERTFTGWTVPIVWVQDGFPPEVYQWASLREEQGFPTRLYDVTVTGLTPEIAQELLEWAR